MMQPPIDMVYPYAPWSPISMPVPQETMYAVDQLSILCPDGTYQSDCTGHVARIDVWNSRLKPIGILEEMHTYDPQDPIFLNGLDPIGIKNEVTPVVNQVGVKIAEVITTPVSSVTTQSSLVSGLTQSQRIAIVIALGFAAFYLLKDKKN